MSFFKLFQKDELTTQKDIMKRLKTKKAGQKVASKVSRDEKSSIEVAFKAS